MELASFGYTIFILVPDFDLSRYHLNIAGFGFGLKNTIIQNQIV